MIPSFNVYLFDIDGTLLDSADDICPSVRQAIFNKTGRDHLDDAFLRKYIGRHLYDLFEDLFPGITSAQSEELLEEYRRIYPTRQHRSTRVYPGVREGLSQLGGLKSTATTKGTPTAREVLRLFELDQFFHHIQGTDGFPAKPAPDVVLASLSALKAVPQDCLLVGDSAADMEAGRRTGVKICAVRYGYGDPGELARFEPDYWVSDLRELVS